MGERPILFSAPMVRAILEGRKTQTRRIVKPQPDFDTARHALGRDRGVPAVSLFPLTDRPAIGLKDGASFGYTDPNILCPFGWPGDHLWVRETWGLWDTQPGDGPEGATVFYRATDSERRELRDQLWRPSIHMPRWASRITLEVTGVRVERLQDISEADCVAEGIRRVDQPNLKGWEYHGEHSMTFPDGSNAAAWTSAQYSYCQLWEQINGPGSWDANPWVWVVEFAATRGEG